MRRRWYRSATKHAVANALWVGIIVVVVCALFGATFRGPVASYLSARGSAVAVAKLKACATTDDVISCARPTLQALLQNESGAEVMHMLSDNLPPAVCHYMGHVVGQDLYRKYGDAEPALTECSDDCFDACIHGIVGEAFVEEAGIDDTNFDPSHLSADDIRTLGSRLCSAKGTCHAVGHALYISYQQIRPALDTCAAIAGNFQVGCASGVFMEFSNELASKSAWKSGTATNVPSPGTLQTFCDWSTSAERAGCYAFLPSIAVPTLVETGVASSTEAAFPIIEKICTAQSVPADRYTCVAGIGEYSFAPILQDPPPARTACDDFTDDSDRLACISGIVYKADQLKKPKRVIAYCAGLPSADRSGCYGDLFVFLPLGTPTSSVAALCQAGDVLCSKAALQPDYSARQYLTGTAAE